MPNCTADQMSFGRLGRRVIEANFEGGALSSDGGLMLLRQVDQRIGLSRAVAAALHDPRNPFFIVHKMRDMITDGVLDGVHIFFPDPWHKARHNKRRLIQSPFISKLMPKIKTGGYIHVATDWENYAEQILDVLSNEPLLENTADGYAPRPGYRPLTKFEKRGLNLGHGVWDLVFKKR